MILGLTGSMGMGKSTVSGMLRKTGIPVFCMDSVVNRARGSFGNALPEIEKLIPGSTSEVNGTDLVKLRQFAFAAPENIVALEAIMKPYIDMALSEFLFVNEDADIVVLDVPLLFERGFDKRCHKIVVVATTPEIQMQRVMARGTLTEKQARELIDRQMPSAEKVARADYVIDTGSSKEETNEQLMKIIESLREEIA